MNRAADAGAAIELDETWAFIVIELRDLPDRLRQVFGARQSVGLVGGYRLVITAFAFIGVNMF